VSHADQKGEGRVFVWRRHPLYESGSDEELPGISDQEGRPEKKGIEMTTDMIIGAGSCFIVMLLGIVAYFLRGRDKRLEYLVSRDEVTREKLQILAGQIDTISKRLGTGADTFREITEAVKQVQTVQTHILTQYVAIPALDKYCDRHEAKHEQIDRTLETVRVDFTEMKTSISGIMAKLDAGVDNLRSLIAKFVTIRDRDQEART
jgi:hypothetical protein